MRVRTFVLLAVLPIGLFLITAGCDPGAGITYENRTTETVELVDGNEFLGPIPPGESVRFTTFEFVGKRLLQARTLAGELVYSADLTWEEIREMDWTVVITYQR